MNIPLLVLTLAASSAFAGCAHPTMTAPLTPSPVMLGPVDRIGGAAAPRDEKILGDVSSISNDGMARTYPGTLAASVLDKTEGREERSARVRDVVAHAHFALHFFGAYLFVDRTEAVTVKGVAVEEVSHVTR